MNNTLDIWEFLAGLGIFLMAMMLLESSLESLTGRTFKKFLRKHTNNPLKSILSGTLITAVLQSSSVVSLIILAFVGAGIIELKNAIGIIIGSNLGTTLTGWIVAYFGFSFDIESFTLPILAFGGLSMVFFQKESKWYQVGRLLVGFGFLFMGLEYMKSSIAVWASEFDISPFAGKSPYLLFILGFVLTAIIQSSSAAMVITLSALNSQIIGLDAAAAMVIGNDLGTTITVLIGGVKGSPSKKRVALSHFLFNFVVDIIALILLYPLLNLLTEVLSFSSPLLALVAFHSSFNLMGILLFFPFLGVFARFLNKRFLSDKHDVAVYIKDVPANVPEMAVLALNNELRHLMTRSFAMNLSALKIKDPSFLKEPYLEAPIKEQYEQLKELEGEITAFYIKVQQQHLEKETTMTLKQFTDVIRYSMTAVKGIKDIVHNIDSFSTSVHDHLIDLINSIAKNQRIFYESLWNIFQSRHPQYYFDNMAELRIGSKKNYNLFLEKVYAIMLTHQLSDVEISTLFNVNREIHSSNKALILGVHHFLFDEVKEKALD